MTRLPHWLQHCLQRCLQYGWQKGFHQRPHAGSQQTGSQQIESQQSLPSHFAPTAPPDPSSLPDAQLATLLDSLCDAVIVLDPVGRLHYANRAWQRLTQETHSPLGKRFADYLHPEDRANWEQRLKPLDLPGIPETRTAWLRLASDSADARWFEIRLQPLPGQPGLTSATLCDINSQVQSEQLMAASHRGLSDMVDRLPVMVYRSRNNREWTMEYISEGCYEVTGYEAADIVELRNHPYGSLIHPDDAGRVWEQVQESLHLRRSFEIEYRLYHADGHLRHVIDKGCGVYTSDGAILAVEGVIFAHESLVSDLVRRRAG